VITVMAMRAKQPQSALARNTKRVPSARGYNERISSAERRHRLFPTKFPDLGYAIQDMKYLDIRMPVRLSFISGSASLYSSSNRKIETIVAHESAVFGQRSKGYGSGRFISDHFQRIIHQEAPSDVALRRQRKCYEAQRDVERCQQARLPTRPLELKWDGTSHYLGETPLHFAATSTAAPQPATQAAPKTRCRFRLRSFPNARVTHDATGFRNASFADKHPRSRNKFRHLSGTLSTK
jgi:hypothetical protein